MFASKYGCELSRLLRTLVEYGERKVLAAQVGISACQFNRICEGQAPLPATLVAPLVLALGPERGGRLLSAVLGDVAEWRYREPVSEQSSLRPHTELDVRATAFEVAIERGEGELHVRYLADRICAWVRTWTESALAVRSERSAA